MREIIAQNPLLRGVVVALALTLPIVSLAVVSLFGSGLEASPQRELSFEDFDERAPSPFQQSLGEQKVATVASEDDEAEDDEAESSDSSDVTAVLGESTTATDDTTQSSSQTETTDPVNTTPEETVDDTPETTVPDDDDDDEDDDDKTPVVITDPLVCDPEDYEEWELKKQAEIEFWTEQYVIESDRHEAILEELKTKYSDTAQGDEYLVKLNKENKRNLAEIAFIESSQKEQLALLEQIRPERCDT